MRYSKDIGIVGAQVWCAPLGLHNVQWGSKFKPKYPDAWLNVRYLTRTVSSHLFDSSKLYSVGLVCFYHILAKCMCVKYLYLYIYANIYICIYMYKYTNELLYIFLCIHIYCIEPHFISYRVFPKRENTD